MHEDHAREQYFFDRPTLDRLAAFVRSFERPLALCCPMLGRRLWEDGDVLPVLDVDERFADLPGFLRWDAYRPRALGEEFGGAEYGSRGLIATHGRVVIRQRSAADFRPDIIIADPPFYAVRPDQLFAAVRLLANDDLTTPLLVTCPPKRASALDGTFARFGLRPTGIRPTYVTVADEIGIEFHSNLPDERLAALR